MFNCHWGLIVKIKLNVLITLNTLVQAEKEIEREAEKFLEMPAIMEERQDANVVLEKRPDLEGYSKCNIVFTDISQGTTNRVMRA